MVPKNRKKDLKIGAGKDFRKQCKISVLWVLAALARTNDFELTFQE